MDKKYQVFISSTYTDLIKERKEVTKALLEMDCIPSGMEMFQASDDSQWELIKRVISSCDYYIVIIAGRYGTIHPETKKSYTQMEYEYAAKIGIPIIGFLYETPENLPANKIDKNRNSLRKLQQFRKIAEKERIVKYWSNPYDLAGAVSRAMYSIIKTHPRDGWVRYKGNTIENSSNSSELAKLESMAQQIQELHQNQIKKAIEDYQERINNKIKKYRYPKNIHFTDPYKEALYKINYRDTMVLTYSCVDALKEIGDIILSSGITGISNFFGIMINIEAIELNICETSMDLQKILDPDEYSTILDFDGSVSGKIYLRFKREIVQNINNILDNDYSIYIDNNRSELFESALLELSGIFAGGSLTSLSCFLDSIELKVINIILGRNVKRKHLFEKEKNILVIKISTNKIDSYLILKLKTTKMLLQFIGFLV